MSAMVKINGERMTRGEEAALENGQRRSLAWVSEAGKAPAVGGAGEVNTALKTCKFLDTLLSPFLFPFVCPCHVLFCNPPQTLGDDAPGGQVLGPAPRCGIQCCQDFWALKELLGNSEGGGSPKASPHTPPELLQTLYCLPLPTWSYESESLLPAPRAEIEV